MNYQIRIEQGCFEQEYKQIMPQLVLVDSNVQLPFPVENFQIIETSEECKDFAMYFKIIDIFEKYKLNRNDVVMIVGGGVLIDVASFAASTYKRGLKYVNVPTTTLSMIDSSVGSKNGLNYNNAKNLIGNITDPAKVIIDIDFLSTLDIRNYNNGIAEAIKIGYLGNRTIIELLNAETIDIEQVIKFSVDEKLKYVTADKYDHGFRNRLNFGHTFGHAIETATNFKKYYHGEAVSIGMVIASGYDQTLIKLLQKFNLPVRLPTDISIRNLIEIMKSDKKNTNQKIKLVLANPQITIVEYDSTQIFDLFKTEIEIDSQSIPNQIVVNKSKSHIHRLLACCLATKSEISFDFNPSNDLSDDVIQSLNVVESCQGKISFTTTQITIDCRKIKKPQTPISIYKSASTYRIFTPILCALFGPVEIKLDSQLKARPHSVFAPYINGDIHSLPFTSSSYQIDGTISSQFISGYIIALITKATTCQIEITGQLTSIPYIDMTIGVINQFGYDVKRNQSQITIGLQSNCQVDEFSCEPDYSSLGYFTVYNKLVEINNRHSKLTLTTNNNSLQADSILPQLLDCEVVDMTNCPDLLPTLIAYGLLNKRGVKLINIERIKHKECDRISAMMDNFADLDAIKYQGANLIVNPVQSISGRVISTYGDHRIAMAAAIIAKFANGSFIIDDYTVVHKSYPMFFEQIRGESNEGFK